jgi:hypothetical protein
VQDSHFPRKWTEKAFHREDSFSLGCIVISVGEMAHLGEWSRFRNEGQKFPREDPFSPCCTIISARGMAQLVEWSRKKKRDNYSSILRKNSIDSPWMMFYLLNGDDLPDITIVSGRMAQMTHFVS